MSESKDIKVVGDLVVSFSQILRRVSQDALTPEMKFERDNIIEERVEDKVYEKEDEE